MAAPRRAPIVAVRAAPTPAPVAPFGPASSLRPGPTQGGLPRTPLSKLSKKGSPASVTVLYHA